MKNFLFVALALFSLQAFAANSPKAEVEKILDGLHQAASKADGEAYFELFAPDGVFLGTDATERWTLPEFKAYVAPHFSKGKGWTYIPSKRHVKISADGTTAWFDESLTNKNYGLCRGSGVLSKRGKKWKISQYHLTIPIPNRLAKKVVSMIREKP